MSVNVKVAGVWQEADETYVKVAGTWKPANQIFVKKDGVWVSSFTTDTSPPNTPILTVVNVDNNRFNVSVRMPSVSHQTDIRRIRVLVNIGGTTHAASPVQSSGYYSAPNVPGGAEPWSDWYYNDQMPDGKGGSYVDGRSTAAYVTKSFAPTWKPGNMLKPNTWYRFTAWAEDMNGNWSAPAYVGLISGKSVLTANENRMTRILVPPIAFGTTDLTTGTFTAGEGYIGTNKRASIYYGNLINSLVGDKTVIHTARVLLYRAGEDHGQPVAKTYGGFSLTDGTVPFTVAPLEQNWMLNYGSTANSLAKGQGVWKDLPVSWRDNLNTNLKAIHMLLNPGDTLNTQALLVSQAVQPRQGTLELYLIN